MKDMPNFGAIFQSNGGHLDKNTCFSTHRHFERYLELTGSGVGLRDILTKIYLPVGLGS